MKVLVYDPFAGISGDMNIGAMVSLGVPESYFTETVKELRIDGAALYFEKDERRGISGIRAHVRDDVFKGKDKETAALKIVSLKHEGASAGQSRHGHNHGSIIKKYHQPHRNLADITGIILRSALSAAVKERSIRMFTLLAEAEAAVHGKAISEVHFHETGAVDSIIDIVCASAAVEYLRPDRIISRPVELGSGVIKCAHGILPVPAPATAKLLEKIPVTAGRTDHEATTPTGAVILKTLADSFSDSFAGRITGSGYGIGSRDSALPNVLRIMLAETEGETGDGISCNEALIMECNIDDMNPELYGNVIDKLFCAGAKDAYLTPLFMKKNRPGTLLTVMAARELEEIIRDIIFIETTTAGIRSYPVRQNMIDRKEGVCETIFGKVRVKELYYRGRCISVKPEYDDMARLASENSIPLRELYRQVRP